MYVINRLVIALCFILISIVGSLVKHEIIIFIITWMFFS